MRSFASKPLIKICAGERERKELGNHSEVVSLVFASFATESSPLPPTPGGPQCVGGVLKWAGRSPVASLPLAFAMGLRGPWQGLQVELRGLGKEWGAC